MAVKFFITLFIDLLVVLSIQITLQSSFAQNAPETLINGNLSSDEYLKSLSPPRSAFETIVNENPNSTRYENSYMGIKLSYPPTKNDLVPSGFEEGCLEDNGCSISIYQKFGGHLDLDAHSPDEYDFSKHCNCDTLSEYVSYKYKIFQEASEALYGTGNFTLVNDNQTTIGNNYPAQQYEYSTPAKIKGYPVTPCDHTIMKHYGILTKVNNTFYNIQYESCAKPQVYGKNFPNVMKVFDSIEFLPVQNEIGTPVTVPDTNAPNLDQGSSSDSLEILSDNSYTDSLGYLHVVGEIRNNSPSTATFVQIVGTFYDVNNQVVGTQFTYTNPSDIGSGHKAPFELLLMSASVPISQIDHYNLQASSQ